MAKLPPQWVLWGDLSHRLQPWPARELLMMVKMPPRQVSQGGFGHYQGYSWARRSRSWRWLRSPLTLSCKRAFGHCWDAFWTRLAGRLQPSPRLLPNKMTKEVSTMVEITSNLKLQGSFQPCPRCLPDKAPREVLAIVEIAPKQEDQGDFNDGWNHLWPWVVEEVLVVVELPP